MLRLLAFPLLLVLGIASLAPLASAQDAVEEARRHFEIGAELYARGSYEAAVGEFELSYELVPSPELLFNIYSAAERAGQLERAISALEEYLASAAQIDDRERLEHRLSRLRQRHARRASEADADAEWQAEMEERVRRAEEGGNGGASGRSVNAPAIAAFSAGGGFAISFAIFAGLALREDGQVEDRCGADAGSVCTDAQVRRLRAFNITADLSLGLAAAGLTTGVLLLVLDPGGEQDATEDEAHVAFAPTLGIDGAGVELWGRF